MIPHPIPCRKQKLKIFGIRRFPLDFWKKHDIIALVNSRKELSA